MSPSFTALLKTPPPVSNRHDFLFCLYERNPEPITPRPSEQHDKLSLGDPNEPPIYFLYVRNIYVF